MNETQQIPFSPKTRSSGGWTHLALSNVEQEGVQPMPVRAVRAPPTMPNSPRPTQRRPRHQRAFLQGAECGADPLAYTGHTHGGLMDV